MKGELVGERTRHLTPIITDDRFGINFTLCSHIRYTNRVAGLSSVYRSLLFILLLLLPLLEHAPDPLVDPVTHMSLVRT